MKLRSAGGHFANRLIAIGRKNGLKFASADQFALGPLRERLAAAASLQDGACLGKSGYDLPDLTSAKVGSLRPGRSGNIIVFLPGAPRRLPTQIVVDYGCAGNYLVIGPGANVPSSAHFQGNNSVAIFMGHCPWRLDLTVRLSSNDQLFYVGRGSTSNGTAVVLEGEGASVVIGEDAMFAAGTKVKTSDLHAIIALEGSQWLNPHENVVIEPHVWIGEDVTINKGATIGAGSIVGAKALVTQEVPRASLVVGIPARVVRSAVTWQRSRKPELHELRSIVADLQLENR